MQSTMKAKGLTEEIWLLLEREGEVIDRIELE